MTEENCNSAVKLTNLIDYANTNAKQIESFMRLFNFTYNACCECVGKMLMVED